MTARDALVLALLPLDQLERVTRDDPRLDTFWPRFDAAAPLHLRLGLHVLALVTVRVLPWLVMFRGWSALSSAQRERVLARAEHLPGLADLMEIGRLVACFAWFDHDDVQHAFRGDFSGFTP